LELSDRLLEGAVNYVKAHREVSLVELPYRGNAPNSLRFGDRLPFDAALVGATRKARWMKTLIARKVPMVSASGDWSGGQVPSVCFSGRGIVRSAVEYLARQVPASLAHVEFVFDDNPLAEGRHRVFRGLAQERGMPALKHQIFPSGDWADSALARRSPLPAGAAARLAEFLRGLPRPAGIWCNDDMLALRVWRPARGGEQSAAAVDDPLAGRNSRLPGFRDTRSLSPGRWAHAGTALDRSPARHRAGIDGRRQRS
jgi:hypothetical protein